MTFDFRNENKQIIHDNHAEPWKVTLVDTGIETMTGGRVKRIEKYVDNQPFMLTYGDGVGDINISNLAKYHQQHKKIATVTAVQPSGRFGALKLSNEAQVNGFEEKPQGDGGWISAGFFVLQPEIFRYIKDDTSIFEQEPLTIVSRENEMIAYKHQGFWQPMDTLRDKIKLEELWKSNEAPWKVW